MRVQKKGKIADIPVTRGTIIKLRSGSGGKVTNVRGIVVGVVKPDSFSRAYGKQIFVCTFPSRGKAKKSNPVISEQGANDAYPVGRVKKLPKVCREALTEYKRS